MHPSRNNPYHLTWISKGVYLNQSIFYKYFYKHLRYIISFLYLLHEDLHNIVENEFDNMAN